MPRVRFTNCIASCGMGTLCVALLLLAPSRSKAEEVSGRATVIDGDTIEVRGERIRLLGIDAPESGQRCWRSDGTEWRCGQRAANVLSDRIEHRNVRCIADERGRWGRLIAVCFLGDRDLSAWLVEQGWAVAYRRYSKNYIRQEDRAKQSKSGVWSGTFVMPWDWRRGQRVKN